MHTGYLFGDSILHYRRRRQCYHDKSMQRFCGVIQEAGVSRPQATRAVSAELGSSESSRHGSATDLTHSSSDIGKAVYNRWTGLVDGTGGLDYWTGLKCHFSMLKLLKSGCYVFVVNNKCQCLLRSPASKLYPKCM